MAGGGGDGRVFAHDPVKNWRQPFDVWHGRLTGFLV
jgi:hypothetical protein